MAGARSVIINFVGNDRVTDTVKGIGKQFDKLNDQVKGMAGPAMAAAGAAAAAGFAASFANAIELDSARGKIEAQLGLTKDESKRVGQVAGQLYADAYGESMEDVTKAISSVIQNMDGMRTASSAALRETAARAMDVATVLDDEVGRVTAGVTNMLRTGLAASSQEAFDILTKGAQMGGNRAQDLLDTFEEYAVQFQSMGLSGKAAMGLIVQGLQGGARNADLVADSIKEFSIEAVAGGERVRGGFQSLGLNADQMVAAFAAGGPKAASAFDQVLDSLRGIEDPARRNAVAVELFGTKAEDMAGALLKMDPSSAVKALGDVTGAADNAGKALGETTQAKFERFKRTLMQDTVAGLMAVVGWFQKHETTAKVLAGVVATLTAAYVAYNIVAAVSAARTALMTEGTVANTIVTKVAAAATKAWTAIQWAWNAAMSANPIGLVIVAIAALVAAVIIAYKNSETFRNIVQAAWAGIKNAVQAAWDFMKPVFEAIGRFITDKLVPGFQFLWAVARAVFSGVWEAVRSAWAVIRPVWDTVASVLRTVLGVAFTVFENLVKTVWIGIQLYVKVWWAAVKLIFDAVVVFVRSVLGPVFTWLYNNIIRPVWDGIRTFINNAWLAIRIIFGAVKTFIETVLAPVFTWLWRNVIVPTWDGIRTAISTVWNSGIRPVFDALRTAVGRVRDAFSTAVNGIQSIWNRLQDIAKKPVNFIIGLYNNGIVKLVEKIASFAGIGTRLTELPYFARGGVMPGYAPGRDSLLAAVSPGESIFRPEFTKAVGSNWVLEANAVARSQGPGGVARWMSGQNRMGGEGMAFARGGIVPFAGGFGLGGIVDDFVSGVKNFTFGNALKAAESMLGKLIGVIPGSGVFRDVIAAVPNWIKDNVLGWLKDKIGVGGKGLQAGLNFARQQAGKPYVWGGVGPGGFDCSGFMSAITNVIQGRGPFSRMFTTHSFDGLQGPGGFIRNLQSGFMVGVTDAGVGHMAGTLLGHNVESSGSAGVRVGGGARGAYDGLFPYQYGLTADTGALALRPGWNPPVLNGTGKPELLSTPHPGGQPIVIQIQRGGSALDDLFYTWLRNGIRDRGGNVQVVLGRG